MGEIGEKQLSACGSKGGQICPLMHVPLCVGVECTKVVCVSKVVVSGFLNQWRENISEICGCKTMDDFVKDDEFMLIATILK